MAKEDLLTIEAASSKMLPGRLEVPLDNHCPMIADAAGKMSHYRSGSIVGDLIPVEITPHDLSKKRIVCREKLAGPAPRQRRRTLKR